MGFEDTRYTVVIQCLTLIKRSCISKDNKKYHLPTISGKKNYTTMLGFINVGLQEQEVYDFSADFIRDWATHVSSQTKVNYADIIPFPVSLSQHAACAVTSTQEA